MITKKFLEKHYVKKKRSARDISLELGCSENKVTYWLRKHKIPKRSIADAVYAKCNPTGDPFDTKQLTTKDDLFLFGLGIGLYWGEGTKSNKHTVRLGNADPALIKKFIQFLEKIYSIKRSRLHFGLQIFSDMSKDEALSFWVKELRVNPSQFQKVIVTPTRSIGNYRQKTQHGVLTVHFNNKKLRDIIVSAIAELQTDKQATVR